jgi:hypothetical protein
MSNVAELRNLAKSLGIRGFSVAKKADLIQMIEGHQQKKSGVVIDMKEEPKKEEAPKPVEEPKQEIPKPTEVVKHSRKQSDWNAHLAEYRKTNNVSLREAMSKARESYVEKKQAKPATHDKP